MDKLIRITTVPVSLLILLRGQLLYMSDHYEVIAVSSKGSTLDEVADLTGVKTVGVDMTRKITPLQDIKALWNLYKLIKKEKPLIVHTHTPKAGLLGMMAAKIAGVPVRLHTVAGMPLLEATGLKRKLLDFTEIITYKCATMVYPNSRAMAEIILQNKYCRPQKIKVIGNGSSNGIDTTYFEPSYFNFNDKAKLRSYYGIADDDVVLCFIGRVVKDKGVKELVQAFNNLYQHHKNIKLLIVGPFENDLDPLDEETENLINKHAGIILAGFQKDVRPFLSITDLFVFPSYREGFPNVVMQAGAMGLPCIVSNINGCNEIIVNGENGIIVPVKNVEQLEQAMQELIDNKALRESMAAVSRMMITSRYDQQFVWQELLKEYEQQKSLAINK